MLNILFSFAPNQVYTRTQIFDIVSFLWFFQQTVKHHPATCVDQPYPEGGRIVCFSAVNLLMGRIWPYSNATETCVVFLICESFHLNL